MTQNTKLEIKKLIQKVILKKIKEIKNNDESKPFFENIFSKKDILIGSTLQSIYTSFGMSLYEQIGKIIAEDSGFIAITQYTLTGYINDTLQKNILEYWVSIKNNLKTNSSYCLDGKIKEIEWIKSNTTLGSCILDGDSTVDLYVKKNDGSEFYFDITTVKNNLKSCEILKLKLLRWVALRLGSCETMNEVKTLNVNTFIAIPYNPENYFEKQWTSTILDKKNDIMVQEEFWNFLGDSPNTYSQLLELFKEVGQEIKKDIDEMFNIY